MSKTRPFKQLRDEMSPERQAKNRANAKELLLQMPLSELRQAQSLTQVQLAETLKISQPSVAKIENQTDMYVSTLRRFITAMGGELKIVASFSQGDIEISQFAMHQDENKAA